MPYCPKCGKEVHVDAKFCTNCGTPLGTTPKVPHSEWITHRGPPQIVTKTGEIFELQHEMHLCVLWSMERDVEILRPFAKNANFVCKICGRVAEKQDSLCDPTPI